MKTLSRFRAKSVSGSGDIDCGHKKPPPSPPQTYKGQKSPGLIGLMNYLTQKNACCLQKIERFFWKLQCFFSYF